MFYLFAGEQYYPNGGMRDYKGVYSSEEDAMEDAAVWCGKGCSWWQIAKQLEDGSLVVVREF